MIDTFNYILKKYNLTVGNQFFVEIPNMGRDDLAKLFAELNFKKGVEVGVDRGEYSEVLCKANPSAQIYGVDPYELAAYEQGIDPKRAGIHDTQEGFEGNYEMATKRLAPYKNYIFLKKYSADALKNFEDNSLDFVYIDANHDFLNIAIDLDTWKRKVRMGGILSGHDYAYYSYRKFNHVKRVVEIYTRCYRMRPYFVVGSMNVVPGQIRDRYRSWFWVKDK